MSHVDSDSVYYAFDFGDAPEDRPYIVIDMAATIDGKTVTGEREDHVIDLASKLDHRTLRAIESAVDAVLIGAATLRANPINWSPRPKYRFVLTHSNNLPADSAFFREGEAYVVSPALPTPHFASLEQLPSNTAKGELDFGKFLSAIRHDLGIKTLLVEGGSEVNAMFLQRDMIDEIFLTIAPKIKLGRETPTFAGGEPLPRDAMLNFELIEHHVVEGEVFLRYRRERPKFD